jgi:hypothetical protein
MADLSSNAPTILAAVGSFVGAAVLVVTARVYVRSLMLKTFGADDYVMVGAGVSALPLLFAFLPFVSLLFASPIFSRNLCQHVLRCVLLEP